MRYKEFNRNKLLETCISLFWKQSFHSISINEIVKTSKVSRSSLYHEFPNKRGILDAALTLYLERYSRVYFSNINSEGDLKMELDQFYKNFSNHKSNSPSGCFILYIAIEMAGNDEEVNVFFEEYLKEVKAVLQVILNKYPDYQNDQNSLLNNLVGLFCSTMSLCYVQTAQQNKEYINLKLDFLLN